MFTEILIISLFLVSLVVVFIGIRSINEKAIRNYFTFAAIFAVIFFGTVLITSAQENPSNKKEEQNVMQHDDMMKCMNNIAADSTMRMQMMSKMMEHTKGDTKSMMQMCKKMMNNPEMHKMMMRMMHGEGSMMDGKMMNDDMMKIDSTKIMNKSEHELHHKK